MTDRSKQNNKVFLSPRVKEYNKILLKNPKSLVFINLGDEYRKGRLYQEAVLTLEEGLKHNPGSVAGLYMLGLVYFEMANYEKSRTYLEKVLAIKEDNLNALKLISRIYIFSHWISDAKDLLIKAIRLYPEDNELKGMFREVDPDYGNEPVKEQNATEKENDPSDEVPSYQEDPPTSIATVTLARLYIDQGFYQKGIAIAGKILKKDPMNQEAISLYEEAVEMLKKKRNARKADAAEDGPDSSKKRENRLRSFLKNITKKTNKEVK